MKVEVEQSSPSSRSQEPRSSPPSLRFYEKISLVVSESLLRERDDLVTSRSRMLVARGWVHTSREKGRTRDVATSDLFGARVELALWRILLHH